VAKRTKIPVPSRPAVCDTAVPPFPGWRRRLTGPLLAGLAATLATLATLGPDTHGPGITCDELYHVLHGKRLVMAWEQQGLGFFAPANIARNFPWSPDGPPVHPPLGNWILGWTHRLFDSAPQDEMAVSLLAARFAPALFYGLLVLLVGAAVARSEGPLAGTVAAAATALVPRMFGHAHFAALDMFTAFFFVAALLAVMEAELRGGRWWLFALAGLVWGLAMLVRLHGVLLLPPVAMWMAWRGIRRLRYLGAWGISGLATLFVGWPWLWLAPLAHLRQFLGTGVHRQAIEVFYWGRVWADHEVPWHYAPVMILVTLPLGLLLLGVLGIWANGVARTSGQKRETWALGELVLVTLIWLMVVFAWPGTPVYDGVRLFLMVFPLWALLVGTGTRWMVEHSAWWELPVRLRASTVGLLVAGQAIGLLVYHPCQLSHYNLLVGGLWGAEKLGFEVTYWGDSITEPLLAEAGRLAPGQTVVFGPNLAPFQAPAVAISSPALVQSQVELMGWRQEWRHPPEGCDFGIFYHRRANLAKIPREVMEGEVIVDYQRQGVWLARIIRFHGRERQ